MSSDVTLSKVIEESLGMIENFIPIMLIMFLVALAPMLFLRVRQIFVGGFESDSDIEKKMAKKGLIDIYKRGFVFYFTDLKKVSRLSYYIHFFDDDYIKTDVATYKKFKQRYEFLTLEYKDLIQKEICKPLMKIENDMYLLQFYESINYSLATLSNLANHIEVIDYEQEIFRVVELVNNISSVIESINNSVNERVKKLQMESLQDMLNKHAVLMEQFNNNVNIFHEVKKK